MPRKGAIELGFDFCNVLNRQLANFEDVHHDLGHSFPQLAVFRSISLRNYDRLHFINNLLLFLALLHHFSSENGLLNHYWVADVCLVIYHNFHALHILYLSFWLRHKVGRRRRVVVGLVPDVVKIALMDYSDCRSTIDYIYSLVHLVKKYNVQNQKSGRFFCGRPTRTRSFRLRERMTLRVQQQPPGYSSMPTY